MPTWSNTRPRLPLPACSIYVTCGGCCAPSATIARLSPPSRTESPSMNQEEQVPQARPPAAPVDAEETLIFLLKRRPPSSTLFHYAPPFSLTLIETPRVVW